MKNNSAIIQAITTEKSSFAQGKGKYTFMVQKTSTKIEVKQAIKELYGAEVATVRTMLTAPKKRTIKGKYEWTKRPVMKKAIVTLKGGKTIDPSKLKDSKDKK
ncbi:MAG: 50S ribosomal protein L23 [Patescibacteria group bacterium]